MHFQVDPLYKFPHIDEDENCWQPNGFKPELDRPENEHLFLDYEDKSSEVMRDECADQAWMRVCQIPLYWEQVDCDIYSRKEEVEDEDENTEEKAAAGGLPTPVVLATFVVSGILKGLIGFIAGGPLIYLNWTFGFLDWTLTLLFNYSIGLVCAPCAGVFIWIINIVMLPFWVLGWIFRFMLETIGLLADGWLLIFNFSGCYMFIGRHCGLLNPKFTPWRFDIPILNSLGMGEGFIATIKSLTKPPEINTTSDILKARHNNRMNMFQGTPIMGTLLALADKVVDHINF